MKTAKNPTKTKFFGFFLVIEISGIDYITSRIIEYTENQHYSKFKSEKNDKNLEISEKFSEKNGKRF